MTVYNLFFIYRDGDSYLTGSFISSHASLESAMNTARTEQTRPNNTGRKIHIETTSERIGSTWIEANTDCRNGDYLIIINKLQ